MKCPFCASMDTRVVDSRLTREGEIVRRRRGCERCARRFTTYERVEELMPMVLKRDGRREAFDRSKVLRGLKRACQKRPISIEDLERLVDRLEQGLQERGGKEVPSSVIGEMLMDRLHELDDVAYVRFASVYRQFKDLDQFLSELHQILRQRDPEPKDDS